MEEAINPFIAAIYASALAWGLTIVLLFAVFRLYDMLAGAVLGIMLAAEAARCECRCRLICATGVAVFVNMLFSAAFFVLVLGSAVWRIALMIGLAGFVAYLAASYLYCRRQAGRGGN
jgi:small-conductance mechanosensitive channel